MRISPVLLGLLGCLVCASARADEVVDALLEGYRGIDTLRCDVRRERTAGDETLRRLSRVYYADGNRIHVENVTPFRRRIVSDGRTLHYHRDGMPQGWACPVDELPPAWARRLQTVPGTPMEHLLLVRDAAGEALPAAEGLPVRRRYRLGDVDLEVGLDDAGRVARVVVRGEKNGVPIVSTYTYLEFRAAGKDSWVAARTRAELRVGEQTLHEDTRLTGLVIDEELPRGVFDPAGSFEGVHFVDTLEEAFGEE